MMIQIFTAAGGNMFKERNGVGYFRIFSFTTCIIPYGAFFSSI